ncbi:MULTISPECIES: NAD(P)H-dependent oxidoreductase [Petrimonas]|jgi:nitroreductase/dihydropteridine reductase|uniref:NAD(P)H-dependent oxidoreductase n=1 Tax=Petrimonas TaxID=307628 RepID=UPI0008F1E474|nr:MULTISPECIES: NAD(P)H-dependent oxidoreductase [Petrimonas]MDD3560337.1 NAD(P)H-dependent oxidoreductase [Petrimonas mucosa]SFU34550.1 Nitroreductase [Porphyromonadaceae bacterium KHP3R9]HHT30591.1 NAD(P)H-dependent oxidoreductase [Petrimonas mucosa]
MDLIEALNWRYATKRMTGEKIAGSDLDTILEAIRLTPTAYGLQPFKVVVVTNEDLIDKIYRNSCPQVVIKQCSHLLLFKARKRLDPEYLEGFLNEMRRVRNASDEYIDGYRSKIERVIENPEINKFSWMIRQTYIALGYATVAAAMLGIDATPIEGFDARSLNEMLGIDTEKEEVVVLLTLGYRDEQEDKLATLPKIRKPMDLLVERME